MSLLVSELSVWDIAHRWAGFDPDVYRPRIPLLARDNCRNLIDAILSGELVSHTLQIRKWTAEDGVELQKLFIRYYMDDVYACVWGKKYNRQLLKQASVERYELKRWCDLHSIPLPEFWFPPGWGLSYEWERETEGTESSAIVGDEDAIRPSTRARIACQKIAQGLWKEHPGTTIADMVKHPTIQRLGGAAPYAAATVREWLSAIAPIEVKEKRGRPRKKMPGDGAIDGAASEA